MTLPLIVGIIALVCGAFCGIMGSLWLLEMVDKVNERLPEQEKFDALGWYLKKWLRLNHEYRRLYPRGPLLSRILVVAGLAFLCLLVCAWGFGLFAK